MVLGITGGVSCASASKKDGHVHFALLAGLSCISPPSSADRSRGRASRHSASYASCWCCWVVWACCTCWTICCYCYYTPAHVPRSGMPGTSGCCTMAKCPCDPQIGVLNLLARWSLSASSALRFAPLDDKLRPISSATRSFTRACFLFS